MIRTLAPVIFLLTLSVIIGNCSKGGGSNSQPQPSNQTILKMTVKDDAGNLLPGAVVNLYTSDNDRMGHINAVAMTTADANGVASFTNLLPTAYYWYAEKGCYNNYWANYLMTSPIVGGTTNTMTSILGGHGTIRFVNTSANTFFLYIDGLYGADAAAYATVTVNNYASGAHTLRALQHVGLVITGADISYSATLTCGGTITFTFP
jgi:hypothetical protein